MGFMDKVKAQAEQAMVKAQQGVAQGQTKLDDIQTKRAGDALIASLGAAYYAEQRQGGATQSVTDALAAVDAHVASHGPIGAPAASGATPAANPAAADPAAPAPPAAETGGSFNLDDI
jgi:hypothetical protein